MQRANRTVQDGMNATIAAVARVMEAPLAARLPSSKTGRKSYPAPVAALVGVLRGWWRRERERRELAAMHGCDFGDLTVPPNLVIDELRRWPWQKSSPQWGEVAAGRPDCDGKDRPDILDERRAPVRSERPNPNRLATGDGSKRVATSAWSLF